ncbi:hypothetical protein BC826DRAFT_571487 [Russula brevipes]|nr:hypothetical protein BC826DRAFT_571487 [Russula brevipes]
MENTDHPIEPDMQTVFSRLHIPVPNDAMVDTDVDDDTVNTQVKRRLAEYPPDSLLLLKLATRNPGMDEDHCSDAIDALASVLLPAVFDHSRNDSRVLSYKGIIKRNPWLIKELCRAHKSEKYQVIQRLRVFHSLPKGESRQETPEHTLEEEKTGES